MLSSGRGQPPCCFGQLRPLPSLQSLNEQTARTDPVEPLRALLLATNGQPAWTVAEHHAGGGFIDVLATGPASSDELFF